MRAASIAAPGRGARPGLGAVLCVARPDGGAGPRSSRPAAPRAAPPAAVESPAPAPAAPAAAAAAPVGATAVPLPAALQGTVIPPQQTDMPAVKHSNTQQAGAASPKPSGVTPKRRDRRRRRLAKQRAEAAAAAEASAAKAAAVLSAGAVAGAVQQQMVQEQQRRRRQKKKRQPGEQLEAADGSSASNEAQAQERERQIPITPKQEDLMRWYADVTAAAEQAHRMTATATSAVRWQRGQRQASAGAAKPLPSFAQTLQAPLQAHLGERLDDMGFVARQFPQIQPLDVTRRQQQEQQQEQQQLEGGEGGQRKQQQGAQAQAKGEEQQQQQQATADAAANGSSSASPQGTGSSAPRRGCTTATFARWAAASGWQLPLLASQWQRSGPSWELFDPEQLVQESHAAHEWGGSAEEHARAMIELYESFALETAALPVVAGRLPASMSMPGAAASYTLEAVVGDGRALQVASAHNLADNYTRMLLGGGTQRGAAAKQVEAAEEGPSHQAEQGEQGEQQPLFSQMSSGIHASLLGGMALAHSDDSGLRLPPALAPVQVLIVPLLHYRCDRGAMAAEAARLCAVLESAGVRVAVDWRRRGPAGVRFGDSERKGVPLRIELGPRDIKARTCVIAQRHRPGPGGKLEGVSTDPDALADTVRTLLDDTQSDLRWDAAAALQEAIVDVSSFMELRDVVEAGKWARGPWAGSRRDEAAVLDETGASLLCFPLVQPTSMWGGFHTCLYSGYQTSEVAIFARLL